MEGKPVKIERSDPRRTRRLLLALFLLLAPAARAEGPWEGFWETYSFGDDAFMSLRQDGDRVAGAYFPYDGRIEGRAEDGVLRGTWTSPNGSGTFVFTLTPDGERFSGFIGAGEWWNGRRIDEDAFEALAIDLTSPSHTIRSFLQAGRASASGEITGLQAMFSTLRFDRGVGFAEKSRRAKLLFDALSLTTFRVFDVRPPEGGALEEAPQRFTHRFRQRGTGESLTLEFDRDVFGLWRIAVPDEETLDAGLRRFLAARGMRELDPTGFRELANPRDTMKAFADGMARWDLGGDELVRSTFDLSAVSERLRDWRLPILASFMARNLNRVGELTLEEFPDDPESRTPFVYYEHPAGNIEIAPLPDEDGVLRWRFTAGTLAAAQPLHDALRTVPVTFDNVPNPQADSAYFVARSLAYSIAPWLTHAVRGVELWQWSGLLTLAVFLPLLVHFAVRPLERAVDGPSTGRRAELRRHYSMLGRLLGLGALWVLASTLLGLPDGISSPLNALGWLLVIVGVTWYLYLLVDGFARGMHVLTKRTETNLDDVAVTLVAGLVKILLILGAALAIADVLGLPYETVLAGVGISGLAIAIASRDLLANLFGSAIIAADQPFKKGDFITVGGVTGTVENVGLRSTRLRPLDDTTVSIPNSMITTDRVTNISHWRQIRVVETIHIDHDSSIDDILALRERVRDELLADDVIADEMVRVGLSTASLYAVEMDISFYILTNVYDDYLSEKHRILAHVLTILDEAGVKRAVIRKE